MRVLPRKVFAAALAAATLLCGMALPATANALPEAEAAAVAAKSAAAKAGEKTIELSTAGSKDTDKTRTQQYFQFENGDWTGYYIRPGITAKFRITLNTTADGPNVLWAHRQAGRVDANNHALVRADDGGKLKAGVNEITYDTTKNKVGQVLLVRNDGGQRASVVIENENGSDGRPSLGEYPLYTYDAAHPEAFWTYLTELRSYVDAGVDTAVGQLNDDPDLGMDMTSLVLGRMVYDLRAAKMVDSVKDIDTEAKATAWIRNVYKVANDRLDYFDGVLGFDGNAADARQKPTRMKIVLEMTQNLTSPSTMFAWYTMYHLGEGVWPGVATSVEGSHGWGNDHEFGHMLDIAPLAVVEETNNLVSMWGRREAGIDKLKNNGTAFTTSTYHSGVLSGQKNIDSYLNAKLAGENPESPWGDIWYDVTARFNMLRFFDDYDYSAYDFGNGSGYTKELADQVNKYGGLGAVYRQVRRTPRTYTNVGGVKDAAARAYSDALGFDMSEVMGRYGMTVSDATAAYTAKYPKLTQHIEYFSIDADAKGINGARAFTKTTAAPNVTTSRPSSGRFAITASYPDGSIEAKSTAGYTLLADGKAVAWSQDGTFTVDTGNVVPKYTVIAYDYRTNPSPEAAVPTTADVTVVVKTSDGADTSKAVVHVKPDDPNAKATDVNPADGKATLKGIGSATVSVTLDGYTAHPAGTHVDALSWQGGTLQFTLTPKNGETATTPRPTIHGAKADDGSLAFAITPNNTDDDVYYTTDGSEPSSTNGKRWTGGSIAIASSPLTVKAIAYRAGSLPSAVAQATFTDSRVTRVYDAIYGPAGYGGNYKDLGIGAYSGKDELGELYDDVRSLNVPNGLKVTLYEGENLTGKSYTYTSTVNWVNGYNALPIKSIRVETVKAPEAKTAGTVTFKAGADDAKGTMADLTRYQGVSAVAPDVAFTRDGWDATGWTDGKTVYKPGDALPDGDLTLTATWTRAKYAIAFDAAGGTGTMDTVTAVVGEETMAPEPKFTRAGYTFDGWKLPDGTVVKAGEGVKSLSLKGHETVMLTAVWTPNRYIIRFDAGVDDAGDVTGEMADLAMEYGKEATLTKNAFVRKDYAFAGWSDGHGTVYADGEKVANLTADADGVVTLTAVWDKQPTTDPGETPGGGGSNGSDSGSDGDNPNGGDNDGDGSVDVNRNPSHDLPGSSTADGSRVIVETRPQDHGSVSSELARTGVANGLLGLAIVLAAAGLAVKLREVCRRRIDGYDID
ncbi:hypothetical protein GFD17_07515 [Bifidobacterium sp. SMB2]|uniref:Peptidase M60 domain-containing protein n=1 Tax=Bifidobacterium saimiriisciurei TaxID=2661627 RepID=A0ABX0CDW5_9BIFI|nr:MULTISPECIES: InlB B-repeat-containing protein [Bifidobacterium]NEG96598.1 hypothetical protein [Bifidobacterium sp. SMB2]NEH12381.1 hypothetical protein [Bifidobacterium saimiriisciurei]